jgi:hypothetical protein
VRGGTYIMVVFTRGSACVNFNRLVFTDSKERGIARDGTCTIVILIRGRVCTPHVSTLTEFLCH